MTYDDVLETAKKMGLSCRVCPDCNGLACRGEVPGVGAKGSGKSFTNCVNFLKSIDINLDAVYESHDGTHKKTPPDKKYAAPSS